MHLIRYTLLLDGVSLISAATATRPTAAVPSGNPLPQTDLPCWVTLRGLKNVNGAHEEVVVPASCETPLSILTHQWLGRDDVTHTLVTAIVTARTTTTRTVVADGWTSTIVVSGHGTVTNPIETTHVDTSSAQHDTSSKMDTTVTTISLTATTSDKSTTTQTPLGPVPTSVNSSELSSLFSSLLTDTKSIETTAAPTQTATSSKPPQSVTTTAGSAAAGMYAEASNILPTMLAALAGCFVLVLLL